jgi:hypothetical protein
MYTHASEGGHLKQSFSGPPVASAQDSRGRHCGGDLSRDPRQSEQVFSAQTTSRALRILAVAAAAATFRMIHARASKLRSRLRALRILAVAAAAATFRVIHARASEGGHLKQSFSGPPVASA